MRANAAVFSALLPTLWAAHNVGDHLVQTDHQAVNKAASWKAMLGHVGGYQLTQAVAVAVVMAATAERCNPVALIAGTIFSGATHAFIDRRWPVRKLLQATGSKGFADLTTPLNGPYLADQALHHGCLFAAALIMSVSKT